MKIPKKARVPFTLSCLQVTTACGTYVPQLHEAWEEADVNDPLAQRIKQSIFCELRKAIIAEKDQVNKVNGKSSPAIPDNWGAQVTISLQVDETGALNPGITYTTQFWAAHTFTLGAGGTVSSQATRIDKYYSFFDLKDLKPAIQPGDTTCMEYDEHGNPVPLDRHGSSYLLSGNLGIDSWLKGALISQNALPSSELPKSLANKADVLSYDVKFIVITSANASPTWRFVKLTAGSNTPFVSANRTRTHELILTLGPSVDVTTIQNGKKKTVSGPGQDAYSVHLSSEIGQAVGSAVRGALQGEPVTIVPVPVP